MAINLVRAGFDVWVNDLNQESMRALSAFGVHEATLEDIAVQCNAVADDAIQRIRRAPCSVGR